MIEVFSAIFSIEGIQLDKAKFQIISILTGTGFTTGESELMLSTKRRRKLTQTMILFSYIFNITILSTIVNIFISTSNTSVMETIAGILLTLLNFTVLMLFNKSGKCRRWFDNKIKFLALKMRKKKGNSISIYDIYGDNVIAEVNVRGLNKNLININLEKINKIYDIQILAIRRGEKFYTNIKNNRIKRNDILIVYGKLRDIKRLFKLNRNRK